MKTATVNEETVIALKEKIEFYESIFDNLPALIFINEIENNGDLSSLKCVWSNRWGQEFIGYNQQEISAMGSNFTKSVCHFDDLQEMPQSLDFHEENSSDVYFSFNRLKPKDKDRYHWVYQRVKTFNLYPDGYPRQSLNVAFELHKELQSPNKLVELLHEINRLKHELHLRALTRREKEILRLISKGKTDREIGENLRISVATAKTHRNKILKKLVLKNSAALAAFAAECGV